MTSIFNRKITNVPSLLSSSYLVLNSQISSVTERNKLRLSDECVLSCTKSVERCAHGVTLVFVPGKQSHPSTSHLKREMSLCFCFLNSSRNFLYGNLTPRNERNHWGSDLKSDEIGAIMSSADVPILGIQVLVRGSRTCHVSHCSCHVLYC